MTVNPFAAKESLSHSVSERRPCPTNGSRDRLGEAHRRLVGGSLEKKRQEVCTPLFPNIRCPAGESGGNGYWKAWGLPVVFIIAIRRERTCRNEDKFSWNICRIARLAAFLSNK